jgi:phage terminase large subunit-like protein
LAPAVAAKRKRATRAAAAPPPAPPARTPGKYERLCWERHDRDLALAYPAGVPADPRETRHPRGLWFDAAAGERVVHFIERFCRHSKGEWAGRRIVLEEWQRRILRAVFGWMRADGTRRFRIAYVEIPRKNAKSTTAGAVGLYLLVADNEPGAEIYSSATKEDQAKIVWGAAEAMVKQSPELRRFVRPLKKNLSCGRMASKFEPLGADSDTLDGLNPHGNVVDELHAHKNRALWDVLITAMGARRQPVTLAITTAGVYDPETIGWQMHDHACKVLEGVLEDDAYFAFIAAADPEDDWRDPATWAKANPNLGVSVKRSYMAEECDRAKTQPSFLNTFLRLHLDRWTEQVTRWITMEKWNACTGTPAPLEGRRAFGGLDLSSKLDLSAFTLLAEAADGCYDCFFRFWVPEELVQEREQRHLLPSYSAWVRDGLLITTPGNVIDYDFIKRDILEAARRLQLREIGYDPWNAEQIAIQLLDALNPSRAETGFQMVSMRQGMATLSEPSKEFEKLVVAGKLRHGGHPVMRWMVANATTRTDANGNIAPDKSVSTGKIDGVVSTILALGRAIHRVTAPAPRIWSLA